MKSISLAKFIFLLSFFCVSAFAQERDDVVFFWTPPSEGVSFNNIGAGWAQMSFNEDGANDLYNGVNLNCYHKHSWWALLASGTWGKGQSDNPEDKQSAFYVGAYAGVDLVRSPKLAFELYPLGVCANKNGADPLAVSLGAAGRFCIYFRYNMAFLLGGEMTMPLKKDSKRDVNVVTAGIQISL